MSTELQRRNSLERYQPKKSQDGSNFEEDNLSSKMNGMQIEKQPRKNNQRRSINNHLFGKTNNDFGSSRGRGRGRGRGSFEKNKDFDDYNVSKKNVVRDNENMKNKEHWKSDRFENEEQTERQKFVFNEQQVGYKKSDFLFNDKRKNSAPRKKNTETFKPSHKPADMRILAAHAGSKRYLREMTSRDVLLIYDVFCSPDDLTIYNKLLKEIETSGLDQDELWQSWHGDSHVIADDKKRWKDSCPTFHMVLDKIRDYFQMDIKATRLNWYRDSNEWKPFHHDAAAIKPDKARTQNLTVGVSFGAERDAAFEHATTKTVISMPQPNGTIYTFGKDVNVIWRHGILQVPPEKYHDKGRISIIAWGWAEQTQV